jgi:hypothetical protein
VILTNLANTLGERNPNPSSCENIVPEGLKLGLSWHRDPPLWFVQLLGEFLVSDSAAKANDDVRLQEGTLASSSDNYEIAIYWERVCVEWEDIVDGLCRDSCLEHIQVLQAFEFDQ